MRPDRHRAGGARVTRALWLDRAGAGGAARRGGAGRRGGGRDRVQRDQPRHRGAGLRRAACREAERARMRAPLQEGEFPFPVKYGYAAVGRVVRGAGGAARARRVRAASAPGSVRGAGGDVRCRCPRGCRRSGRCWRPTWRRRSTWSGTRASGRATGSRWSGPGVVGALAGWLCARTPGVEVTLVDVNPARAALAEGLGCRFAAPEAAPAGVRRGDPRERLGARGSRRRWARRGWRRRWSRRAGTATARRQRSARAARSTAGGCGWSRRRSGRLPPARRAALDATGGGWRRRWRCSRDPALEALISGETAFEALPARYGAILDDPATLCHRVRYR